jgi:hypothetical protein
LDSGEKWGPRGRLIRRQVRVIGVMRESPQLV